VTSDPPIRTRRRQAIQSAFTNRQAELARPQIEAWRPIDSMKFNRRMGNLLADHSDDGEGDQRA
jgi:cytochrome P450